MPLYPPSQLDADQVIQHAFDETTQRLRTDATINTTITGDVEVAINATEDNIAISDGVDTLEINNDGSINVEANVDGVYNASTNTDPDNIGVVLQTRNSTASDIRQIERPTAIRGTTDSSHVSIDVSVHDNNGEGIESSLNDSIRKLEVNPTIKITTANNIIIAITNVSKLVLAANSNRKYAYIYNQTGGVIHIKLGATAVFGEGIRMTNNTMYEINSTNLWVGDIYAIKSGATPQNLDVFEGT